MFGQSRDSSSFTQIGTQVTVLLPVQAAPEVRYSLPPDAAAFTGRGEELSQITAVVIGAVADSGVVVVGAIDGMPGVGKTALAVHAAHMLRDRFPDRQLFINLHGHTPGQEPVRPEDALAGLLTISGVDPRALPDDLDSRAQMWRDRMAGQRALLVLDNAASSRQVAPLLPGGEDCLVLVTSRRHLSDLPGTVLPVLLDTLPPQKAEEMFTRLAPRAAGSPGQVAEVVRLAGFLPLAISLLARVYARHRSWTLADLVAETRAGLLTVTAEHDSIGAAFAVSYQHLDPARQRFFCLLGLHPAATTDAYAAAALAGTSLEQATKLLDGLHGEGLLTETGYRRYGMHDLIRRYARDHAADLADGGQQALDRLLDYYQRAAALAGARLARQTRPGRACPALAGQPAMPHLDEPGQALVWARADRASLLACLDHATGTGQHARVVAFTAGLAELWRREGPWADAAARHAAALEAARCIGDRLGEANALTDLGTVRWLTNDYPGAAHDLRRALGIYRDLGDRLGQANALNSLGAVWRQMDDYPGAAHDLGRALGIYRDLGDRLGQANVLTDHGIARQVAGDYRAAAQDLEQALVIFDNLGDRLGQANALNYLGTVRRQTGDYPGAIQTHGRALDIFRDLGDRLGEASALKYLGIVRRQTGDYSGAAYALDQAFGICHDLGDRLGQAATLTILGSVRQVTGDYWDAAEALEQALSIYHDLGNRGGEVTALNERGTLYRVSGDLIRAERCHKEALRLARAIAYPWDEAHALAGLGRCAIITGNLAQGQVLLREAQGIFHRIGAAEDQSRFQSWTCP